MPRGMTGLGMLSGLWGTSFGVGEMGNVEVDGVWEDIARCRNKETKASADIVWRV